MLTDNIKVFDGPKPNLINSRVFKKINKSLFEQNIPKNDDFYTLYIEHNIIILFMLLIIISFFIYKYTKKYKQTKQQKY